MQKGIIILLVMLSSCASINQGYILHSNTHIHKGELFKKDTLMNKEFFILLSDSIIIINQTRFKVESFGENKKTATYHIINGYFIYHKRSGMIRLMNDRGGNICTLVNIRRLE